MHVPKLVRNLRGGGGVCGEAGVVAIASRRAHGVPRLASVGIGASASLPMAWARMQRRQCLHLRVFGARGAHMHRLCGCPRLVTYPPPPPPHRFQQSGPCMDIRMSHCVWRAILAPSRHLEAGGDRCGEPTVGLCTLVGAVGAWCMPCKCICVAMHLGAFLHFRPCCGVCVSDFLGEV